MKITIRQPQCFTEIGRKENQEDYLWPSPKEATAACRVFLMCDGVGGQDHGEVASRTAATALGTYLTNHVPEDGKLTKALFEEALAHAYDALDQADATASSKMATTMTCLALHSGGALIAHIGDSRVYHIRPSLADANGRTGIIYQSTDHSLVNDLLRAGELTEEEAANFPHKNVITRAMQPHMERRCKADIYNEEDVQAGDYFFLCCDGVLEQLTNDLLGSILADASKDDEAKIKAIKAVCDGKTRDNYTCWLIPVESVEGAPVSAAADEDLVAATVEPGENTETEGVKKGATQTDSPRAQVKYGHQGKPHTGQPIKPAPSSPVKRLLDWMKVGRMKWGAVILLLWLCSMAAVWFYAKGVPSGVKMEIEPLWKNVNRLIPKSSPDTVKDSAHSREKMTSPVIQNSKAPTSKPDTTKTKD